MMKLLTDEQALKVEYASPLCFIMKQIIGVHS